MTYDYLPFSEALSSHSAAAGQAPAGRTINTGVQP